MENQTVKSISLKEHVPLDFAYKILKKLEHSGITQSTRGKNGGYRLSKAPNCISMLDVFIAIDARLFANDDAYSFRRSDADCRVSEELEILQDTWIKSLKERTLDMLV